MNSPPFDAKKYKALMGGLEAVELKVSELLSNNKEFRLDSDYFSKYNLMVEQRLLSMNHQKIGDFAFVTDGIHASIDFDSNSKINLISAKAPKFNTFDLSSTGFISEKQHASNSRTALKVDDIILSTVGTIGNCAVVDNKILPANSDRHVGIIRINKDYLPHYVSTFLLSKYGMAQSKRHVTGNVQPNLFLYKIRNIIVPFISHVFQKQISESVIKATQFLDVSEKFYTSAEDLLSSTLDLSDFVPSGSPIAIKTLTESFGTTGRLDAEYYQQKYEEFGLLLGKFPCATLESICSAINYGTVPTSPYTEDGQGIPYVKGMNLKNLLISGDIDRIVNTEGLAEKFYTQADDIIISQMGTVGDVGVAGKNEAGYLFASFTIRVRLSNTKKYNPYFVGLYIQNVAKQWYLARNIAQASVRQNTDLPTIRNMPIPFIKNEIQNEIADKIQQSFTLRRQSESLLTIAKRAVEIAIEENEAKALKFIEKQSRSTG